MHDNKVLNNIVLKYREDKLAHAYLIETNNIELALKDLKELLKIINCPEEHQKSCHKCNLCNLITKENLPSIKIIEPDGTSIKKSQIEELKNSFETIPIYSRFNTYIIKNADKLNASSANSMLKFIEEPHPGIIGFFLTNNKDIMIDTIKSRCQSLTINYENKSILDSLNIDKETYQKYQNIIPKFLNEIKNNYNLNNKNLILTEFPERKDIENILKLIFELYYHNFLKLIGREYNKDILNIYQISDKLPIINKKLQIINKYLTNMSYNVSMELILDALVLEMRGIYE